MASHCNCITAQGILGIVERLRLRNSKRLTVNVIRNQQRNRTTFAETDLAGPQGMGYVLCLLAGLGGSLANTWGAILDPAGYCAHTKFSEGPQ